MLNDDIDIQSKYKNFLIEQYSVDILNRLMKISSITAVIVYIFWIVSKYNSELFGVNNIYLVVSSIFLLQVLQSIQIKMDTGMNQRKIPMAGGANSKISKSTTTPQE